MTSRPQATADFFNPPAEYRGAPFWAWNGKLEPTELRRQIREMYAMGLGGFFMHSRVGLDTAYLSDEWMDCVRACVEEAADLGMRAWLYDEDRWPSGAAGGLVTRDPEYRQRAVVMLRHEAPQSFEWSENTLGAITAKVVNNSLTDVRAAERGSTPEPKPGETLFSFEVRIAEPSSWFNGYTYLDLLNPAAVREFIRVTHEAYEARFSDEFGKTIPGMFTDEPQHQGKRYRPLDGDNATVGRLPWTGALPEVFQERYGYDLLPHLAEVFCAQHDQTYSRVRHQYHDCVAFLFSDSFARQIGEWCERTGMLHTGHLMEEVDLRRQNAAVSDPMRFYEYMQAPGMDLLSQSNREYDTAKQVSSVAHQFNRRWRLTETYGCTGWDFNFEGHKALGDWQAALGINLRCQHLSWYTMEGQAKRDYPASIHYQSPWAPYYRKVEDYFARINAAMDHGQEVRDVLVLHPIESVWGLDPRDKNALDEQIAAMQNLRDALLSANIDFDYGSEEILARHGAVADSRLRVAEAEYTAVIVPSVSTLRASTLDLLRRFHEARGQVVFLAPVPTLIDAEPSDAPKALSASCQVVEPLSDAVNAVAHTCRRLSICSPEGTEIGPVLHLLREDDAEYRLFVCNTGQTLEGPTQQEPFVRERTREFPHVVIRGFDDTIAAPRELNLETGQVVSAQAKRLADGTWEINTSLPRIGSRLFILPKTARESATTQSVPGDVTEEQMLDQSEWDYALSEPNVLTLDRAEFRVGDSPWHETEEILRIDHAVREHLGIQRRGGRMVQPWAAEHPETPKSVPVELRYTVDIEQIPTGTVTLAVENPHAFTIRVNGTELSADDEQGWWVDRSLRRLPVDPASLRTGRNTITMALNYDEVFAGLECAYLLGDFGVALDGVDTRLVAPPPVLALGNWTPQGLPFYSGNLTYRTRISANVTEGKRLFVRIPAYSGTAVRILIDGEEAGMLAWPPYELDITQFLPETRECELGIQILGHRRNSHGPLHLADPAPTWTGAGQFVTQGDQWTDAYHLVPLGLMQPPVLQVRG